MRNAVIRTQALEEANDAIGDIEHREILDGCRRIVAQFLEIFCDVERHDRMALRNVSVRRLIRTLPDFIKIDHAPRIALLEQGRFGGIRSLNEEMKALTNDARGRAPAWLDR